MTKVVRKPNESIERLLGRLRRQIIRKGTLKQIRKGIRHKKKDNKRSQKKKAIYREKKRKEISEDIF